MTYFQSWASVAGQPSFDVNRAAHRALAGSTSPMGELAVRVPAHWRPKA
jgi:hypothetical protein